MKKTLYFKFLLAYLIFGFFSFLIVTTFVPNLTTEHFLREKAESLYSVGTRIAENCASGLYTNSVSLEETKKELDVMSEYLGTEIWIINPSGRLVMSTGKPLNVGDVVMIENFDPSNLAGSYYVVDDYFGYYDSNMLNVTVPISSDFKVKGYVVMHTAMSTISRASSNILGIFYITLAILLLLSIIILIFFTEVVYNPLQKIIAATEEYATGNLEYELSVDSDDEIGYLAASLSYMASEIARGEEDQKKFIANISHDFRSPLTSIKGYLEAIIDGTIPPEMHEKYLNIVLNETDRLHKLTNSLLTLNRLSASGMRLEKTEFDINNVIRNTAASFEGTCRKKTIAIELVLTNDKMFVVADMGKIQQVLYNLLDNAIKFSHQNSVIKIETFEKKNKLLISVKDSGIGIPKEEVKLVFDRFYKSDSSRGKDKKGTGLGLAIVKEIITAHSEHIDVISTPNVGTEFIFSLPLSSQNEEDED